MVLELIKTQGFLIRFPYYGFWILALPSLRARPVPDSLRALRGN